MVPTISPDTVDQESPEKQISLSPESIVEPDGPSASTSDQKMNTELRTEKSSASSKCMHAYFRQSVDLSGLIYYHE